MRKLYVSPKAELLCMAPSEKLTAAEFDFDDLLNVSGGIVGDSKVDIDIPTN